MPKNESTTLNIALVGGGEFCKEILEKSALDYRTEEVNARILAVADPDLNAPGMLVAKKLGLKLVKNYAELYNPKYNINLITLLTPDQKILEDILQNKPIFIRLLAYHVLTFFWKLIGVEEAKLRERNKEIETILNGIRDFILVLSPDKSVMEVNEVFLDKMGYELNDVIGKKCHEVFQLTDDRGECTIEICPLSETIKNKRSTQQILTRVNSNGKTRYIEVTVFPIWEEDGRISKFVEISRDITDRKREEEEITRRLEQMVEDRTQELKETHVKLLHQDKMASLGKLSASVVHEINNPIAGILNLTILIKRMLDEGAVEKGDIDKFSKYLVLMETETRRISRIVSNLLAFSRHSKIELKQVEINRIIDRALFLNSNLLKIHQVKVEEKFEKELPNVMGSEDQLQQVFMNLISNTVEAIESKEKGSLEIITSYDPESRKIQISFSDTGVGIPKENLDRLFEPFFTTKKDGKGVGLGLSVVYGIIQDHGGSIHVESDDSRGTTFLIELPFKKDLNAT